MAKTRNPLNEGLENTDSKVTPAVVALGDISADQLAGLGFEEVDPLKGLDAAYNAGQEGFLAGTTKLGHYVGTKTCVSTIEKKPTWKDHPTLEGKVTRRLHHFQVVGADGQVGPKTFGIWSAGNLDAMLKRIPRQTTLAITYEGKAEVPYKKGQTPPHLFKLRGKGIEMKLTDLDAFESDEVRDEQGDTLQNVS